MGKAFGRCLQDARADARMDQRSFADALGVSRTTVSNIERGTQRVFLDQVIRAAEILGKHPAELIPAFPSPTEIVVRAASDDPLPPQAERSVGKLFREVTQKYRPPTKS